MAKKIFCLILSLILLIPAFSLNQIANALDTTIVENDDINVGLEDIDTTVTFDSGKTEVIDAVIDIEAVDEKSIINSIDNYSVNLNDTEILTVDVNPTELRETTNGYYSVEFIIPNTSKSVFLTGLKANRVSEIQEKIIESYVQGKKINIEDFGFIDSDKLYNDVEEYELCWAAASSNIFEYTGYAEAAGFADEDEIFNFFAEHFVNTGADTIVAAQFLLNNSTSISRLFGKSIDFLESYAESPLLPDVPSDMIYDEVYIGETVSSTEGIKALQNYLRSGYGVTLSLFSDFLAHAVSCFGFINDTYYSENDYRRYISLIIADSDSDWNERFDRKEEKNVFHIVDLEQQYYSKTTSMGIFITDYVTKGYVSIEHFTAVMPYSQAIFLKETNPRATKNVNDNIDLNIQKFYSASISEDFFFPTDKFHEDSDIAFICAFQDIGKYSADVGIKAYFTLYDSNYNIIDTKSSSLEILPKNDAILIIGLSEICNTPITFGKYYLSVEISTLKDVDEAFYLNNKSTISFEITEATDDYSSITLDVSDFYTVSTNKNNINFLEYETIVTINGTEAFPENTEYDISYILYSGENIISFSGIATHADKNVFPISVPPESDKMVIIGFAHFENGDTYVIPMQTIEYTYPCVSYNISTSPKSLSPLENGATSFNGDEELFGYLENHSNDNYYCDIYYMARNSRTGKVVQLTDNDPRKVLSGMTVETNHLHDFINPLTDGGTYEIYLYSVVYNSEIKQTDYMIKKIGTVSVKEKPSTVITTSKDVVDSYDGYISLREAIEYTDVLSSEEVATVTLKSTLQFELNSPITIDKEILISGQYYLSVNGAKTEVGMPIRPVDNNIPLFNIVNGGKVTFNNIIFRYGDSYIQDAISVTDADVTFNNCQFRYFNTTDGSIINAVNSNISINNCTFDYNRSTIGSIINIDSTSTLRMLNSQVIGNIVPNGIINSESESVSIISSTFVDNTGVTINTSKNVYVLGCLFTDNTVDLPDNVYASGTFYTSKSINAIVDETCLQGEKSDILLVENGKAVIQDYVQGKRNYNLYLYPLLTMNNGILFRTDSNGNPGFEINGTWYEIDVEKYMIDDFEKLTVDVLGHTRCNIFGSLNYLLTTANPGDINFDGKINAVDSLMLCQIIAGIKQNIIELSDVNKDGKATALDSIILKQLIAG